MDFAYGLAIFIIGLFLGVELTLELQRQERDLYS